VETKGTVTGLVKWFDATKGYGFIVAEGCETDILLHANVLRSFGRNSVANNALIEVVVQESDRGCQAAEIIDITAPEAEQGVEPLVKVLGQDGITAADETLKPARVKWFDRAKGFGFANVFGSAEDIFLHADVLQACGLAELQAGEAIAVRTAQGPRGKMAWDIRVWDFAVEVGAEVTAEG